MFHVTQAKKKIAQRLREELPARLAVADQEVADGIVTPPPKEIHTTDKRDFGQLPSLELIVTDSTPVADSYAQVYRHRMVLGIAIGSDNEEQLSVMIERYVWCARNVLRDTALIPIEGTADIQTVGEQYSMLEDAPKTVEFPFVRGAFIEVFVTTVE